MNYAWKMLTLLATTNFYGTNQISLCQLWTLMEGYVSVTT